MVQKMTHVVQKRSRDEGWLRVSLLCRPGRLERMLGLTDRLAEIGRITMIVEKLHDRFAEGFCRHVGSR